MNFIKPALISSIAALAVLAPTPAEAAPSFRIGGTAANPATGNVVSGAAAHNNNTGARYGRLNTYNRSTQTYQGGARYYNPSTGQGASTNTTATYGSGLNSSISTANNGSYECRAALGQGINCDQTGY